ncbi:hypothetical protein, partial [Rhodoferax sp.]|uniref:hypothetical protein n=1 Tax=Rhodoferax sp. TaxID=50421 RepID=UPI0025E2F7D6
TSDAKIARRQVRYWSGAYEESKEANEEKRSCDMVSSVHRAGLPETGSSTAQRSCHRFKDGRQDASASIARRP